MDQRLPGTAALVWRQSSDRENCRTPVNSDPICSERQSSLASKVSVESVIIPKPQSRSASGLSIRGKRVACASQANDPSCAGQKDTAAACAAIRLQACCSCCSQESTTGLRSRCPGDNGLKDSMALIVELLSRRSVPKGLPNQTKLSYSPLKRLDQPVPIGVT